MEGKANIKKKKSKNPPSLAGADSRLSELKQAESRLIIQSRIADIFLTVPEDEMYNEVLKVILEVMQSQYGVFGYIDDDGPLVVPSMTRHIWDKCQVSEKTFIFPRDTWGDSSWPRAIREKKPNYSNELSAKTPEGHIDLRRHISFPILFRGEVIGLFQVANKETDYTEADIRLLETIAGYVAPILSGRLQRKRGEDALRESESKFKRLYDSNIIGVIFWDTAGNITQANGEFLRMVGYTEDDVLTGRVRWKDMTPPEYAYLDEKALKEMAETGISAPFEKEYIRHDGSRVPILLNAALLKGEKDVGVCFIQDISERKKAEEGLKESERTFRALFDNTPDGIALANPENKKFTMGNETFYQMLGYNSDEIQNLGVMDIHPTEEVNHSVDQFEKLLRKEIAVAENIPVKRKDGSIFFADIRAFLISLAGKTYLAGIFRDITERKRAQEALRESEEKFRTLVGTVPVGIGISDLRGNVYIVNRMLEEMTGYSQEEFKTINVGETYADANDRRVMLKILEETGKVRDFEARLKRKDGTAYYALLNIDQIELGGQRVLLRAQHDITALKKAEEEIMRLNKDLESRVVQLSALNRELERSNRDLEQFAYVASHDLQEPLRMISSFTQLLEQRYKGKLDKSADEFTKFAVDGANRMQRMINDLLSYSRLSTRGKSFEPVNSEEILARVHTNLLPLIEENQALLTHESLPEITADASQMLHLFQNLIGNAIKFRGKEPPRIHVFSESRKEEWMFGVRDNGIGIAKEYFDRIFVIFQRLHGREEYPGTGIGLAICKKIVERHGGRIWVESEPGEGSTFFFTIPKRRE